MSDNKGAQGIGDAWRIRTERYEETFHFFHSPLLNEGVGGNCTRGAKMY